jgi:3-oxoacyl-[acyl-carrier protein] reductase
MNGREETVLITGGASGLGRAMTLRLARSGLFNVVFTYCRSTDAAQTIEAEFPRCKGIRCDFKQPLDVAHLVNEIAALSPSILINNALTGMVTRHFHQTEREELLSSFTENVLPTMQITQQAIRCFRKARSGRIITILSSYLANSPPPGLSGYVACKAYLASLSRSWAAENARFNITSNCISPSMMRTQLTAELHESQVEGAIAANPLKRLVTAEEVADAAFFFATASSQINGVNFFMNGGEDVS